MLTSAEIKKKLEKVFGKRQAQALSEVLVDAYGELVKSSDFNELKAIVKELAEAQTRTEQRVGELAEAQKRTEQRVGELAEVQKESVSRISRLEAALERLAEAQRQNEEQFGRLEAALERLAEAQRRAEERIGHLDGRMDRVEAALERLVKAQERTEEELRRLVSWQWGEDGRRRGERYERDVVRSAPVIFNGGRGGCADERWVRERLAERLKSILADMLEVENDPFLADLIWWKGDRVAVVEASIQVNGEDVDRAARRAGALKHAGLQALAVVIGEKWATADARQKASAEQVEWKVGSDLSEGFMEFRAAA